MTPSVWRRSQELKGGIDVENGCSNHVATPRLLGRESLGVNTSPRIGPVHVVVRHEDLQSALLDAIREEHQVQRDATEQAATKYFAQASLDLKATLEYEVQKLSSAAKRLNYHPRSPASHRRQGRMYRSMSAHQPAATQDEDDSASEKQRDAFVNLQNIATKQSVALPIPSFRDVSREAQAKVVRLIGGAGTTPRTPFDRRETPEAPFGSEEMPFSPNTRWRLGRSGSITSTATVGLQTQRAEEQFEENMEWRRHVRDGVQRQLDKAKTTGFPTVSSAVLRRRTSTNFSSLSPESVVSNELGRCQRCSSAMKKAQCQIRTVSQSRPFNLVCGIIIIVNSVVIGYQSDNIVKLAAQSPLEDPPAWHQWLGIVFIVIFGIEVGIRFIADPRDWAFGENWKWNYFDLLLVFCSLAEELFAGVNLTYFRILRGFRMIRVLRVIRALRFFHDLRLMVCSILQSLVPMIWVIVLLLVIMYVFAVCLLHGVTGYLRTGGDAKVMEELVQWYGGVGETMFTLLLAMSGGRDWYDLAEPLNAISKFYQAVFVFFVFFVMMCVLNVLTSVFVERARELSNLDRDLVIQSEIKQNDAFIKEMSAIFEEADTDGSGTMTWTKFHEYLKDEHVQAYFTTQKLDTTEAHELFRLLAAENDETVDITDFVMGCIRLKGQAKSADMAILLRETKQIHKKLKSMTHKVTRQLNALNSTLVDQVAFSQELGFSSPESERKVLGEHCSTPKESRGNVLTYDTDEV